MEDRILTLHPSGRQGVNISRAKYDRIADVISTVVAEKQPIGFTDLVDRVVSRLEGSFEGSIPWYVTTIKLDLEARGVLERVPGPGPQRLRFASC